MPFWKLTGMGGGGLDESSGYGVFLKIVVFGTDGVRITNGEEQ
jgi:hypothetical protein